MNNDNEATKTAAELLEDIHVVPPDAKPTTSKKLREKLGKSKPARASVEPVDHVPDELVTLDTAQISEGNNYRRTYDETAQKELEASVRTHGVLQPITVRTVKGAYEVVFGTRRLRAAKAVGVKRLVCTVKSLDDETALELQLVENTQRSDVDPLEEAEAFETLHRKMGKPVEELAAKVGKSAQHIYNRLKLCELGDDGRKAYRAGVLTVYTAMLVARIPHKDLQKKAVDWAKQQAGFGNAPSARDFAREVRYKFMLELAKAPFDRKSLTLVAAAGACTDCPKRTGNAKQKGLFGDLEDGDDMCTDPKCYESKVDADAKIKLEALSSQGVKVLEQKETKRIFGNHGSDYVSPHTGFKDLDEKQYSDDGRGSGKTLRALIKSSGAQITVVAAKAPSGKVVEMVRVSELAKSGALKKLAPTGSATKSTMAAQDAERRKKMSLRKDVTAGAVAKIVAAVEAKGRDDKPFWLFLADAFLENAGGETSLAAARARELEGKKNAGANWSPLGAAAPLKKALPNMTAGALRGLVVELACGVGAHFGEGIGKHVKAGADLFHVDITKIATAVKAAKKEKKKPGRVKASDIKKAAKAARGKTKKPAKKGKRS